MQERLSAIRCIDEESKYPGTADTAIALWAQYSGANRMVDVPLYIGDAVWEDTVLDDLVPVGLRAQHPSPCWTTTAYWSA